MIELFVLAVLALHGLACTVILTLVIWRAARWRDARSIGRGDWPLAPEKLEPPDFDEPFLDAYPADEIFSIMAEHFPVEYARYRRGELPHAERSEVWDTCCAIHDARFDIEELCS